MTREEQDLYFAEKIIIEEQAYSRGYEDAKKQFERPRGEWGKWIISEVRCPECLEYFDTDCYVKGELDKCPSCGADLRRKEGEQD